ncbi:uncharacterized protein EI90DRAFT_3012475 [Cantharellus anzutake]|uniref:uncharacterized protein n=1 Tax=Cantharellus anzutake TaxID=1750568 RepID=UPI001907D7D2|nr:uncharacterized protein EI90DRAFT_3012475 [Cantharellus anzutake]KAF8340693.1 hypothetical protein EI90DRAFT_3012475 [Cantharellus anzutake]
MASVRLSMILPPSRLLSLSQAGRQYPTNIQTMRYQSTSTTRAPFGKGTTEAKYGASGTAGWTQGVQNPLRSSSGAQERGEYGDRDSVILAPLRHWETRDKYKSLLGEMAVAALARLSSKEQWSARERRIFAWFLHTAHSKLPVLLGHSMKDTGYLRIKISVPLAISFQLQNRLRTTHVVPHVGTPSVLRCNLLKLQLLTVGLKDSIKEKVHLIRSSDNILPNSEIYNACNKTRDDTIPHVGEKQRKGAIRIPASESERRQVWPTCLYRPQGWVLGPSEECLEKVQGVRTEVGHGGGSGGCHMVNGAPVPRIPRGLCGNLSAGSEIPQRQSSPQQRSLMESNMLPKSYIPNLSHWDEADLAEGSDDDVILMEAKFKERRRRRQARREYEEMRRRLVREREEEAAEHQTTEEAPLSAGEDLPACSRCIRLDRACVRGTGKGVICASCQKAKVKCDRAPGAPEANKRMRIIAPKGQEGMEVEGGSEVGNWGRAIHEALLTINETIAELAQATRTQNALVAQLLAKQATRSH